MAGFEYCLADFMDPIEVNTIMAQRTFRSWRPNKKSRLKHARMTWQDLKAAPFPDDVFDRTHMGRADTKDRLIMAGLYEQVKYVHDV